MTAIRIDPLEIEKVSVLHKKSAALRSPLSVVGIEVVDRTHSCVIDHEQAVTRSGEQREPDIGSDLVDAAVVLREGLQVTLGSETPVESEADQIGGKVTFRQIDEIAAVAAGPSQVRPLAYAAV
jgi:hypothetical protein